MKIQFMVREISYKNGTIGSSINWNKYVKLPSKSGNWVEAFGSADAIIDNTIESLLRSVYNNHQAQDLINEIHLLRGSINFDGLILLRILQNKTVVDEIIVQRVWEFKRARNLVCHNSDAEYSLVLMNPRIGNIVDQTDLEEKVK